MRSFLAAIAGAFVLCAVVPQSSQAVCTPSANGTNGNDTITCTAVAPNTHGNVSGLAGNDTITISGGTNSAVNGNDGDDTINVSGGTVATVGGGNNNDTLNLSGGTITSSVTGDAGTDTINLTGGSVFAIDAGTENDTISLTGGSATATTVSVRGGTGDDIITVNGSTIAGAITAEGGNDTITLTAGSVAAVVDAGTGNDTITMNGGSVFRIDADAGDDIVTLTGGTLTNTGNSVSGGTGQDIITVNGATIAGSILADGGNDTITMTTGSVAGNLDGGSENDTITMTGGSARGVVGGTGDDTLNLNGGSVFTDIDGGWNNDLIVMTGGTVSDRLFGGEGDDTITMSNGSAEGIDGYWGMDFITQTGGSVITIDGGRDNDEIRLNGGNVTSTGTAVTGGDGDDMIELNGSAVAGAILGEAGSDTINWLAGSVLSIDGGDGSDTAFVSAGAYDGSQVLDGGDDMLSGDGFVDALAISGRTISTTGSTLLNWEILTIEGGGMTLTDGAISVGDASDATTGLFLSSGAYLRTGSPLALIGNLSIGAGSVFEPSSSSSHSVSGRLANAGTIDFQNGEAIDVLSIGGDYAGGGTIVLDVDAAATLADRMEIAGDVSGATTRIDVGEISGREGGGRPIEVVTVGGLTQAGDFEADSFLAGAYLYSLELDGQAWAFLPTLTSGGNFYPTLGGMVSGFTRETVASHYRRSGGWGRARMNGGEQVFGATSVLAEPESGLQRDANLWLRGIGAWAQGEGVTSGGTGERVSYDRESRGLQGGVDVMIAEGADYLVSAGVFAQFGKISGSASDGETGSSAGSADTDAIGLGSAIAFEAESGYGEVAAGWNEYRIDTVLGDGTTGKTDGQGYFVSIEGGRIVRLSGKLVLVPQAQLAWIGTDIDGFDASDGMQVSYDTEHAAEGRIGLGFEMDAGIVAGQPLALTGIFNLWQNFGDPALSFVAGQPLSLDQSGGAVEAGLGFAWGRKGSPVELYGEGSYRETIRGNGEETWNATLGAKIAF